ncbi:MAG: phage integrase SAM-like domain-containing protein [bacterium]|nr:phage integrase SAM-like domain-containing protein [bacterium]
MAAVWVKQQDKKYNKKDKWSVFIKVPGKKNPIFRAIGYDKKEAEKVAADNRKKLALEFHLPDTGNNHIKKSTITFKEYADKWYQTHSPFDRHNQLINPACLQDQLHWKPTTAIRNEELIRLYLIPVFGELPMENISKTKIKDYFINLSKQGKIKPRTVSSIFSALRTILNEAIVDEIISANPVNGIAKYLKQYSKGKIQTVEIFSEDEVRAILRTAKESFPHYYPFILCDVLLGLE